MLIFIENRLIFLVPFLRLPSITRCCRFSRSIFWIIFGVIFFSTVFVAFMARNIEVVVICIVYWQFTVWIKVTCSSFRRINFLIAVKTHHKLLNLLDSTFGTQNSIALMRLDSLLLLDAAISFESCSSFTNELRNCSCTSFDILYKSWNAFVVVQHTWHTTFGNGSVAEI